MPIPFRPTQIFQQKSLVAILVLWLLLIGGGEVYARRGRHKGSSWKSAVRSLSGSHSRSRSSSSGGSYYSGTSSAEEVVATPQPTPNPTFVAQQAALAAKAETERIKAQNEKERTDGLKARWFFGVIFAGLLSLGVYGSWEQKRQGEIALAAVKMAGFRAEQAAREATNIASKAEKLLFEGRGDAKERALEIQSLQFQIEGKLANAQGELERAKEKGRVSPDVVASELEKAVAAVATAQAAQKRVQASAKEAGREATIATIKHAPQAAVHNVMRKVKRRFKVF